MAEERKTAPQGANPVGARKKPAKAPRTSLPISIARAPATTATAAAEGSSDLASSTSSNSDYHSIRSTTSAAVLLSHLSPQAHRTKSRSNSFASSVGDGARSHITDASSDADSIASTSPVRRRPRSEHAGPALLRPRPISVATTASFDGSIDLPDDSLSIAGSSIRSRKLDKSQPKSSTATLRPSQPSRGPPPAPAIESHDNAQSHAGVAAADRQPHAQENSKAAVEELARLQQGRDAPAVDAEASIDAAGSPQPPPEVTELFKDQHHQPEAPAPPQVSSTITAGHPHALLQRDAAEHAEMDDKRAHAADVSIQEGQEAEAMTDPSAKQRPCQQAHFPSNTLSVPSHPARGDNDSNDNDECSSQVSATPSFYQLRRRKGYRTLSKRDSQSSMSTTDDDDGQGRTSSSSLDGRLSNETYTTTQSASQLWEKRRSPKDFPSAKPDSPGMTALERQIHDDSQRVKEASANLFTPSKPSLDGKLALMVSLHVQFPGLSILCRFTSGTPPATPVQQSSLLGTNTEHRRRHPDLLKHATARRDLSITHVFLNRSNAFVKVMILSVLIGSWWGRTVGLL